MFVRDVIVIALAVLLVSTAGSQEVLAQSPAKLPRFDKTACWFEVPTGQNVTCGYLTVLENRAKPAGRQIQLAIAIFKAQAKQPQADPIVFLNGGPGGYTLQRAASYFAPLAQFGTDRDVILYDQRGVGFSKPALDCPEDTKAVYDSLATNLSTNQVLALHSDAMQRCHDRLVKDGIELSAYNSVTNAADLNDMRTVLGYGSWNLFGASYGTRLALITLKLFPRGIRSVVLDSTYPPQLMNLAGTPLRAFNILLDGCKNDSACNAAYPELRNQLYALISLLNAKPVLVTVEHPLNHQSYQLMLSGNSVVLSIYYGLYSSKTIPKIPAIITAATHKDYDQLAKLALAATVFTEEYGSKGAGYSVGCAERIYSSALCDDWPLTPLGNDVNQPVTSPVPTLILAGEYDPVTPPTLGQIAGKTLRNSYFFKFPGLGHGVSFADACPRSIMQAFFQVPTRKPDSACIAKLTEPVFELPPVPAAAASG